MNILDEAKYFFKPVKVANVEKVMSVETWFVLNIILCLAMIIFFFWFNRTDMSIAFGAICSCFLVPRFLAGVLGVEK